MAKVSGEIPKWGLPLSDEPYIRLMPSGRYKIQVPGVGTRTVDGLQEARSVRDSYVNKKVQAKGAAKRREARVQRERDRAQRAVDVPYLRDMAVQWLDDRDHKMKLGELKRATVNHNRQVVHQYVLPHLRGYRMDEITPRMVDDWRKALETEGATRKDGGVGPKTVRNAMMVLGQIYKYAMKREEFDGKNPLDLADKPKKISERIVNVDASEEQPGKVKYLTKEQAHRLIDWLEERNHHLLHLIRFQFIVGLRPGELIPLEWRHVDLERGRMDIRLFYEIPAGGQQPIISPIGKNNGAYRTIPFAETLKLILKEQRETQAPGESLVFPSPRNRGAHNYEPHSLRAQLIRACQGAGVPVITPYGLRHTCATMMLRAGMNPKVAAERLGHNSTKQFLDTYSHVEPILHEEGALVIEGLF